MRGSRGRSYEDIDDDELEATQQADANAPAGVVIVSLNDRVDELARRYERGESMFRPGERFGSWDGQSLQIPTDD